MQVDDFIGKIALLRIRDQGVSRKQMEIQYDAGDRQTGFLHPARDALI